MIFRHIFARREAPIGLRAIVVAFDAVAQRGGLNNRRGLVSTPTALAVKIPALGWVKGP
jgi:hypothetical protein